MFYPIVFSDFECNITYVQYLRFGTLIPYSYIIIHNKFAVDSVKFKHTIDSKINPSPLSNPAWVYEIVGIKHSMFDIHTIMRSPIDWTIKNLKLISAFRWIWYVFYWQKGCILWAANFLHNNSIEQYLSELVQYIRPMFCVGFWFQNYWFCVLRLSHIGLRVCGSCKLTICLLSSSTNLDYCDYILPGNKW